MKILIAEDDVTSRVLLEALTRKWGYTPVTAEDGEAAWQILQAENPPRLLLVDWEMPHLSGLSLCQRIRRQVDTDPVFIILLTARNETLDIVSGLEAGANEYITKPFNQIELKARVQVGHRMLQLQSELNQAKEALLFQASHDVLTGLLNRRAILTALDTEMARAQRQQQALCVAMCDIDFFKQVNDNYGHLAGDYVLHEIAQHISSELRPFDLVGRYGGEEFLLILNAPVNEADKIFERIRSSIETARFTHNQQVLKVTISCGISIFTPPTDHRNALDLIDSADKALYSAKESGRNVVVFAD
ncbi:MAG: two-component system, cell cycle response regulator [Methyloprofundus sp.]|nr:MAG: two-component system, cell cycle response regulator [Methyloprofundus sp.]